MTMDVPTEAGPLAPHTSHARARLAPKELVKSLLASGLPYALLRMRALRDSPVTVLCYHTLRPDADRLDVWTALRESDFVQQMRFLRKHYDIVSLDEALEGDTRKSSRPRAVITFDDGEVGLHDSLLPIVTELRLPVTLYIATRQIETGKIYWFDAVMNALQADGRFTVNLTDAGLKSWTIGAARGAERWGVISDILETLKGEAPANREVLAQAIVAQSPPPPEGPFKPLQPLSVAQLAEVSQSPWVTIGAHSHCHSLLDQIPIDEVRASAERSRELLEAWTGKPVRHFAYPNGNHNAAVEAAVADAGFVSATVTEDRLWRRETNHLVVPRILIGRYDDFERFKLRLTEV